MIGAVLRAVLVALLLSPAALGGGAEDTRPVGDAARLWRDGARAEAVAAWSERLDARVDGPHERARLAYNLGVAASADGDALRATAWFESALRLDPRNDDAAHNVEISRADAGLPPAASGDLTSAATALMRRFEPHEARLLALGGALLVLLVGLVHGLRGGRRARAAFAVALLAQPLLWAPLVRSLLVEGSDPVMVVAPGAGASVVVTPDSGAESVGRAAPGDVLERVEVYGAWTKVVWRGEERWIPSEDAFALVR
ncbi:MAG: hypothetical protein AAFZ87_00910 [Planctomycetota bacterium]